MCVFWMLVCLVWFIDLLISDGVDCFISVGDFWLFCFWICLRLCVIWLFVLFIVGFFRLASDLDCLVLWWFLVCWLEDVICCLVCWLILMLLVVCWWFELVFRWIVLCILLSECFVFCISICELFGSLLLLIVLLWFCCWFVWLVNLLGWWVSLRLFGVWVFVVLYMIWFGWVVMFYCLYIWLLWFGCYGLVIALHIFWVIFICC